MSENYIGRSPGITLVGDVNPVGAIGWFHGVPNASYLQLNGQAVQKAAYPLLWAYAQPYLTANQAANPGLFRDIDAATFALPNFSGLFMRSTGQVDANHVAAALGVLQADTVGPHTHGYLQVGGSGSFCPGSPSPTLNRVTAPTDANVGTTETRPSNIALVACIKATSAYVVPPTSPGIPPALRVFAASGNWSKPPGLKSIKVTVVGGGGGGGGGGGTSGAQYSCGAGGGGGGTSIKMIDAALLGASEVVTVGGGGANPVGGAGGVGGTSNFGAHCSATGGGGGNTFAPAASGQAPGGAGGVGAGGDVNIGGGGGGVAYAMSSASVLWGGAGGSSAHGGGGAQATASNAGAAGRAYGGGGSGAALATSSAQQAGGAGAAGVVIVEEFY